MAKLINIPGPGMCPIIALVVPLLLLLGNKGFGLSSGLRHIGVPGVIYDQLIFTYPACP